MTRGPYCSTLDWLDENVSKCIFEIVDNCNEMGIGVNQFHSECAKGQFELAIAYNDPVQICDDVQVAKEVIINVAAKYGFNVSFMPKFDANQIANSQHCHMSIWKHGVNLFKETLIDYDLNERKYKDVKFNKNCEGFTGEILNNIFAIIRLTSGSHNSLKRFVPGCFSGSYTCWGIGNKEAPLRVISGLPSDGCTTIEFKAFDAFNSIYIGLAALLAVGLDGIIKGTKLDMGKWIQGFPKDE